MTRRAFIDWPFVRGLRWLSLAALGACTAPIANPSDDHLERHFEDSGQNYELSFDGVDDYLTTATADFPLGRANQTLSAWFKVQASGGRQAILTLRKDFDSGVELAVEDGVVGAWRVFAGDRELVLAKSAVSLGAWHHAAFTFDTVLNSLYVDGVLSATSETLPDKRTPTTCWVGTLDGSSHLFSGSLDSVHVWNTVRSPEQIASEVAGGSVAASEPNLVLDLTFDESGGALVFDHSGRENDGQLGDGVPLRMPKRVKAAAPRL